MNEVKRALIMALLLAVSAASARQADGTLGILRVPNDGFPAVAVPGTGFQVVTTEPAEISLVDAAGNVVPGLTKADGEDGVCTIAAGTPPGAYGIKAISGDKEDVTRRSVYVIDPPAEYYIVAHITDVHVGNTRRERPAVDVFKDMLAAVNDSGASFVVITGDITDNGTPEQFRQFLDILATCRLPTYVCPGNHDRTGQNYEMFFGPTWYMFRYGEDSYLSIDTKDFVMADDLGPQNAYLQIWRRATRGSRWSIGFSHRYDYAMGMRAQIALFVDDPLDMFVFGHYHGRMPEDMGKTVPWSNTRLVMTPAAADGLYRLMDVAPQGIRPREPQKLAAPQPSAPPAPPSAETTVTK